MDPRDKTDSEIGQIAADEAGLEAEVWDDLEGTERDEDASVPEDADIRTAEAEPGDLPEEEDDNAYQHSDAALPDDREERAIARRLAHSLTETDKG